MKSYWINVRLRIGKDEVPVGRAIQRPVGIRNEDDIAEICGALCNVFRTDLKVPDGVMVGVALVSWQRFEEDTIEVVSSLARVQ